MQKAERLVAIALLLQARGKMTARRLANILGVSTRTIYRDIMALSLAHVPVSMEHGPGGGYYLAHGYHFDPATFTREEAVSLVLGADIAGRYSLFAGDDDLHRALFKLEATLPETYRTDVNAAREHILFDTSAWRNEPTTTPYLETIHTAILDKRQMEIIYPCIPCNTTSEPQWQRIDPYGLVCKGIPRRHARVGIWYLIAYCQTCQKVNPFRISAIVQLKVCDEPICNVGSFNLRTYWRTARRYLAEQTHPFRVKLRISPTARSGLRGNYVILHEEADGSAIICIEVDSFEDAISYTLGLGKGATVLCPARVRQAVAATAQAIVQQYDL